MAITAAVTTIPGSGTISNNQKLKGVVAVTNGNATPVEVIEVSLWAARTGKTDGGNAENSNTEVYLPPLPSIGMSRLINNSATNNYTFDIVFFAPRQGATLTNAATQQYDIGATVYTSDGSATAASVQTVTITALST